MHTRALVFLLLSFAWLPVNGQIQATLSDTLQVPRLVVKASMAPLLTFVTQEMSMDLGAEVRLKRRYTIDFFAGVYSRSPFSNNHTNTSGYYGSIGARRYFLKTNGLYFNFSLIAGQKEKSHTVQFSGNGVYFMRTRATRNYRTFYPAVGWHGSVFRDNKFPFDFSIGLSYEKRNFSFTNLSPTEIELVTNGQTVGIEDFPHRNTRVMVMFWLKIGIVALR